MARWTLGKPGHFPMWIKEPKTSWRSLRLRGKPAMLSLEKTVSHEGTKKDNGYSGVKSSEAS